LTSAVAVLAAGLGERFGSDTRKPLVDFAGRPLASYAFAAAGAAGYAHIVAVVSDAGVAELVPEGFEVVWNHEPARGISSSVHTAIRALMPYQEVTAVVIGLADQPLVGAEAYRRLAAHESPLAVATYNGTRGNPVRIGRMHWDEALTITGDQGARVLFQRHDVAEVPCDGTGDPTDIDTPADLARLETQWRSQTASE
jgi:CTP:molybdopterin cytidylyltransferase MocA